MAQWPNSPGTMADDATVAGSVWSLLDRAKVSDNSFSVSNSGTNTHSHYLKATNFLFSIPSGATINGILIKVQKKASVSSAFQHFVDYLVNIVKSDGTFGITNRADLTTYRPTTKVEVSYGSSTDLWGEVWSENDINNSNFGVALSTTNTNSNSPSIDYISITVYYTSIMTGVQSATGISTITF